MLLLLSNISVLSLLKRFQESPLSLIENFFVMALKFSVPGGSELKFILICVRY